MEVAQLNSTTALTQLARLKSPPPLVQPIITEMLWQGAQRDDPTSALREALALLLPVLTLDFAGLSRNRDGRWEQFCELGAARSCPTEILAEALDREESVIQGPWGAALLTPRGDQPEVLAVHGWDLRAFGTKVSQLPAAMDALAAALGLARQQIQERRRWRQREERLLAMLQLAQEWSQAQEVQPLLLHMAEASTRLLHADRASIFLWDKPNQQLVARPALGVPGNELRIPDHVGIVGKTLQTGRPQRVNLHDDPKQIHRDVDKQLNYHTRSLLCVPLRAGNGELLGVFEMINKLDGEFTDDDEQALLELAAQAAPALANTQQLEATLAVNQRLVERAAEEVNLVGACPSIRALQSTLRRVAPTELAVLLLGENGTGKEVVSQSIHYLSPRRNQPFIAVNCAALSETLLESELFGHEKGAFTDAHEARQGKFELATGGTLFLDEIGDLSRGGQAKLLRVLEEKVVVRVGGSKPIPVDVRIIAATNQNLAEMVRQKRFREDLYFRLNVVSLELPPLRERGEDVMLLAEHFLSDFCRRARRKVIKFSPLAKKRLEAHPWPGNVRELRNLMERLAYLTPGDRVEVEDLAFILPAVPLPAPQLVGDQTLTKATYNFQKELIRSAIESRRGNMSEAAEMLGLHRSNLYRKMRQLDMPIHEEDELV
jgi:transcriptional regulator with GAF, ATPase, and Fis domain